ncbi:MAG TPA: ATP-binding protein [Devosia sp.]|nr:ATP-binding protein [Devosia sp.]
MKMRWFTPILPNRIGGQMLLLILFSLVVTQAVNFGVLVISDQGRREESQLRTAVGTFVSGAHMIAASKSDDWPVIAQIVRTTQPEIDFQYQTDGRWNADETDDSNPFSFIARDLGPGFQVQERQLPSPDPGEEGPHQVSVKLPNDVVVTARLSLPSSQMRPPVSAWSLFTFALVFLPLVFFWAAWTLSRRLNTFARAAEDFSLEGTQSPLPETGPEEIQRLARALNRMRDRIMNLLRDRTRMLSAIGHDLRTPITRLRLRAEFIEDEHTRIGILRDLDRMNRMVETALTYIRSGSVTEQPETIDLPALLKTVGDNFTEVGESVTYEGSDRLSITARPDALLRAVENLVENALKYGSEAVLRSGREGDTVFIEVEDNGTGIAEDQRKAVLEPFVRGDAARSSAAGGFGLGLSITDSIAKLHGGKLVLTSGRMGGLLARLVLPASDEDRPSRAAE